jgi:hypothetical protein
MSCRLVSLVGAVLASGLLCDPAAAVDVVRAGKPVATIVSDANPKAPAGKGSSTPPTARSTRARPTWQ